MIKTKYREIKTKLPCVKSQQVIEDIAQYESRSMQGQLPLVWDKAEGFNIYDACGNKWIDFTSTIFVANTGHANPSILQAVKEVVDNQLCHTYVYANPVRAKYLKKLIEFAGKPFEKAFLLSAGTEATEAALKLMRLYGQTKNQNKLGIICIENNWHGRTMGAQMMSSNQEQKKWIGYQDPNIYHIEFPYPWLVSEQESIDFLDKNLEKLTKQGVNLKQDVCGFMLETFQGWGAIFYPKLWVKGIERICEKHDILLCFDEMQAGFGRTGRNFGYQHYQVEPDLVCCGKGMASGFPLSGVIGKAKIMDLPEVGNMSSTHSANPIVCAAGLATIEELIDKNLVDESYRKGKILHQSLREIQHVCPNKIFYILGEGLIAAILFKDEQENANAKLATKVVKQCLAQGLLLVHTGRESIKIGPPLTISDEALIEGLNILKQAITEND